ncbi:MAG TPA: potassium channel family protein [Cyclobacteriaceae bacterium]|nr:potassium channel family protein [Cyclobacteriaceae bacterium]
MKRFRFILMIAGIAAAMIFLNSLLVYFERQSDQSDIHTLSDAFWFMAATLATVGYGDLIPVTTGGTVIGYIFIISSLGVIGYLISTATNYIFKIMEERKLGHHGTSFTNHILIIGWNEFSRLVVEELLPTSKKIGIFVNNKDDIDRLYAQFGTENIFILYADYSNFDMLNKLNASKASVAFISLEDDAEALLYVLDFKKFYPQPTIVVSLLKSKLKETFQAAGVTYVLARNEIASKLVASYIFEPDVADMNLELISTSKFDEDNDIQEFLVTEHNPFAHKNYISAFTALKKDYQVVLLGLYKTSLKKVWTNPADDTIIEVNDYLIILANRVTKKKLVIDFGVDEGRLSKKS